MFSTVGKLYVPDIIPHLIKDGYLHQDIGKLTHLIGRGERNKEHAFEAIVKRQWENQKNPGHPLTMQDLVSWLSEQCSLPIHHIDPLKINTRDITTLISYPYAARYGILIISVMRDALVVATAQPWEREWETELAQISGNKRIVRVLVNPVDIHRYLIEFYTMSRSILGAENEQSADISSIQNLEQLVSLSQKGQLDANDQHVISIVDWLLQYAFDQRASDIHMEPRRDRGYIRFRIDGLLHQVYEMPPAVMSAVLSRLKVLGRMDLAEKRKPQDGRLKARATAEREIELRLSTMPTVFGEKLVMRIFDPEILRGDIHALGFSEQECSSWLNLLNRKNGIILVTGPTGSGKTTTLYSSLREMASPDVNVCTVEDPVEMIDPTFNQMQMQSSIGLDFASCVRTLLRQDPDVIMVGEIRDSDTADMAVQAALTGHIVLSTLHTNDAPTAITRLLELGVPPYLIQSTLIGVLAQRLVRTLCSCAESVPCDPRVWQDLVAPNLDMVAPEQIKQAVGCIKCRGTGFYGRTGIYEMLLLEDSIRSMVGHAHDVDQLRKQAMAFGMTPLRHNGAAKVAQGITTPSEVFRVAQSALEFSIN